MDRRVLKDRTKSTKQGEQHPIGTLVDSYNKANNRICIAATLMHFLTGQNKPEFLVRCPYSGLPNRVKVHELRKWGNG